LGEGTGGIEEGCFSTDACSSGEGEKVFINKPSDELGTGEKEGGGMGE
jgi:hypothetical protein